MPAFPEETPKPSPDALKQGDVQVVENFFSKELLTEICKDLPRIHTSGLDGKEQAAFLVCKKIGLYFCAEPSSSPSSQPRFFFRVSLPTMDINLSGESISLTYPFQQKDDDLLGRGYARLLMKVLNEIYLRIGKNEDHEKELAFLASLGGRAPAITMLKTAARVKILSTVDDLASGIVDQLMSEASALKDYSHALREIVRTAVVDILFGISHILIARPDREQGLDQVGAQDTRSVRALLQPLKEGGYKYQISPPGVTLKTENNQDFVQGQYAASLRNYFHELFKVLLRAGVLPSNLDRILEGFPHVLKFVSEERYSLFQRKIQEFSELLEKQKNSLSMSFLDGMVILRVTNHGSIDLSYEGKIIAQRQSSQVIQTFFFSALEKVFEKIAANIEAGSMSLNDFSIISVCGGKDELLETIDRWYGIEKGRVPQTFENIFAAVLDNSVKKMGVSLTKNARLMLLPYLRHAFVTILYKPHAVIQILLEVGKTQVRGEFDQRTLKYRVYSASLTPKGEVEMSHEGVEECPHATLWKRFLDFYYDIICEAQNVGLI